MYLIDAIQLPQFSGLGPSELHAALLLTTSVPGDSTRYSYSGMRGILEAANVDMSILLGLRTFVLGLIGGDSLDAFLTCDGRCDFSVAGIQQQLAANAAAFAADPIKLPAIQALIDVGSPKDVATWKALDVETEPTLDAVTAAKTRVDSTAWWNQVRDELVPSMITAGADVATIKAAIGAAS